jgi:hypothetical protein
VGYEEARGKIERWEVGVRKVTGGKVISGIG